jgi:hypothetical protein
MHAYSETVNMQTSMDIQGVAFDQLYGVALMGEGCHAFIVLELKIHGGAEMKIQVGIISLSMRPLWQGFTINIRDTIIIITSVPFNSR